MSSVSARPAMRPEGLYALVAASFGLFTGVGVTILYAAGVLLPAIARETGWSREALAAGIAPAALAIGVLSPLVGALTDRFGSRKVLIASGVAQALGLACLPVFAASAGSFVLFITIAAVLGSGQTPVAYSRLLIGWLPERRGLAMGIALACSGLGVAVIPSAIGVLLPLLGWRQVYLGLAATAFAATVIPALVLVRDPPRDRSGEESAPSAGMTFQEAIRTSAFWTLTLAFLLNALTATAGTISLPQIAVDDGLEPRVAATTMIVVGLAMVVSRIVIGNLFDRHPPVGLTIKLFTAPLAAYLLLSVASGYEVFAVAALLFGIAVGCEGDAMVVLLSRRFGMRDFGKIFGVNFCAYAVCGGVGPWLLTSLITQTQSRRMAFLILAGLCAVSVVLMALNRERPDAPNVPR